MEENIIIISEHLNNAINISANIWQGRSIEFENCICTLTTDETKNLQQVETGIVYGRMVYDAIPLRYTYVEVEKPVVLEEEVLYVE